MSVFYSGDRVLVFAYWSTFYKQKGTVTSTHPHLMVRVDGDAHPMRMGERECVRLEEHAGPTGGAE